MRLPEPVAFFVNTSLIIKVDQINEPRQTFPRPLSVAFLKETFADAAPWKAEVETRLDAWLTKVNARNVVLEGETSVHLTSPCRRCLKQVATELPVSFTLNLVNRATSSKNVPIRQEAEDDGEGTFSTSFDRDPDEERFDGEKIDLAPLVREQILLSLPATEPLCAETCLGLCVTCGHNLNEGDCGHAEKPVDPRWNSLKNIKLTH